MNIKGRKKVLEAIKEYQVPGCVSDFDENDFKQEGTGYEWSDHHPGTMAFPAVGLFFLGMPTGFNRLGIQDGHDKHEPLKIKIFESWKHFMEAFKTGYDKFNVPVWKHKNEAGHTFIRGLMPRINTPFLHIILEDCLDKINCVEITYKETEEMD